MVPQGGKKYKEGKSTGHNNSEGELHLNRKVGLKYEIIGVVYTWNNTNFCEILTANLHPE